METITKLHEGLGCEIIGFSEKNHAQKETHALEAAIAIQEPGNKPNKFDLLNVIFNGKISHNISKADRAKEDLEKVELDIKELRVRLTAENSALNKAHEEIESISSALDSIKIPSSSIHPLSHLGAYNEEIKELNNDIAVCGIEEAAKEMGAPLSRRLFMLFYLFIVLFIGALTMYPYIPHISIRF